MMHQCDSHNPHSEAQIMSHTILLKFPHIVFKYALVNIKIALVCFTTAKMFDLLSGIFIKYKTKTKKPIRITFCLSLCFFSFSIPLSPFVVSNWVSLIYSSMMLAWPSLC